MNKALILESISKHISLTKKEEEYFISLLQGKKLKKKQFLVHENEFNKHTAFITKGCLRSYSIDRNGFEHIIQFAPPGWWIADIASVISNQPGKLNIDALEDSEMFMLSREDQLTLFEKNPKFERFFRIITENSIAANSHRLIDYMGLTAQERYFTFCNRYPMLMQSLPQKQIAAYIGVTPEFLSKIKAEYLKKKK
ncbi:Crp/Fnr family transcriptional regulator [Aurantibacillus circumpalustris]|uniref:Crp/Fnr family transcriptional regulator n=1 Tax=Aurantibacillus circumpalustris TaxID=3036359 RepID=UPI00295A6C5E|nr:Crp/Fnr family transcriptional regulator [Aurantibacillus circumpalustris]